MDYAIIVFVILTVLVTIYTRIKLAFIDAATPKYGFPGGPEGGQRRFSDHFGLGGMVTWMLILGFFLLLFYSMVEEGYRGNTIYDSVKSVLYNHPPKQGSNDDLYPEVRVQDKSSVIKAETRAEYDDQGFLNSFETSDVIKESTTLPTEEEFAETENYSTSEAENQALSSWVQVLASSSQQGAERVSQHWMNSGWGFQVVIVEENGVYKVRLGPFLNRDLAESWDEQNNNGEGYLINSL